MTFLGVSLEQFLTGALYFASNFALVVGLAAVGGAVSEQAGVLTLGHEGVMLLGASVGFLVAFSVHNPWLGLLAGVLAGVALGAVKATWSVIIKTDQVINGLVLVPVGVGLANVLHAHQFKQTAATMRVESAPTVAWPYLGDLPVLGPVLFNRSYAFYAVLGLIALVAAFLTRTRTGMILRAAGELPEALDFNGIGVDRYRFLGSLIAGALAGLAGAMLAVEQLRIYHPLMTAGRGWVAIAVVIVGGWRPWSCMLVALLFGFVDMLQYQFQAGSTAVPYELLLCLPYIATLVVLTLRGKTVRPPSALGIPFVK